MVKKVMLYFYPKDGTSGCTQEVREFRDLEQFSKENVVIIGISMEGVESHRNFRVENNISSSFSATMMEKS